MRLNLSTAAKDVLRFMQAWNCTREAKLLALTAQSKPLISTHYWDYAICSQGGGRCCNLELMSILVDSLKRDASIHTHDSSVVIMIPGRQPWVNP